MKENNIQSKPAPERLTLHLAPERRLIRPSGSWRHIECAIRAPAAQPGTTREPLSIALVIDRSGSMSGAKIETAKNAGVRIISVLTGSSTKEEIEALGPDMLIENLAQLQDVLGIVPG